MRRREWQCTHGVGHPNKNITGVDSIHGCCPYACCGAEIPATAEPAIRQFRTGATRDTDNGKPDYVGYLSPLSLKRFGEYMTLHRKQPDGSIRGSDNWKLGIPQDAYVRSMARHFMDVWLHHEGHHGEATEDIESALCAVLFNAGGLLHEIIKERNKKAEG